MTRRDVLLPALAATPRDLLRMLRNVDEAAARKQAAPHGWSIADVVAHLGDVEGRMLARFRRIVEQDNPYEPSMRPNVSAHDLSLPLPTLIEQFTTRRAETIAFLETLDQRAWGRPLRHETMGSSRLRFQAQTLVEHDNEHLAQILDMLERHGDGIIRG